MTDTKTHTAEELATGHCEPCGGDTPPLRGAEIDDYRVGLHDRWRVVDEHHLEAEFEFDDFQEALDFTNEVGEIAEAEGHHPEICLTWGHARVQMWTHAIGGLSENDFILAAKIDRVEEK